MTADRWGGRPPPPATSTAARPLPTGWVAADVGSVGSGRGSSAYDAPSAAFTVSGGGADIWGVADAFHYAYTTLSGDGRLVARVNTLENIAPWTKAGVMIRESLDPGSPHAFMLASAGKGSLSSGGARRAG